ncbi:unnamed protein product [Eruca vesicaria subsp. sativa]|uniref:Replication protein A 70 kDa DNA-binding subunit B/D first OB fold domain-containing protein n=1 Tax=Eruca vesicaria subsp. sativa TaxID=29727 RepID=A0ABC8M7Y3_ERUVS|nr:unnamed protein product [Eruca vesicaria subsp. sativa]
MTHCNKLSEVCYNPKITAWRFRVKIHNIYPFYFYLTSSGPFYTYVLVDKEGTKMEMTIYGDYDRFRGLEKQEGKWMKIFRVEVNCSLSGYQETNSRFYLNATLCSQVHIIDPRKNRLFMDFKNIHAIPHMNHTDQNYLIGMNLTIRKEEYGEFLSCPRQSGNSAYQL